MEEFPVGIDASYVEIFPVTASHMNPLLERLNVERFPVDVVVTSCGDFSCPRSEIFLKRLPYTFH